MLCRKCKTAIEENETICKYCGAKVTNTSGKLVVGLVVAAAVCFGAALYFSVKDKPPVTEPPEPVAVATPAPTPMPTPTPTPLTSAQAALPTADLSMSEDEAWEMLRVVAEGASEYYNSSSQFGVLVTKNGYLFDIPGAEYVRASELVRCGNIDEKYEDSEVLILFMQPNDLSEFSDLHPGGGDEFAIFCAYEIKDGFGIMAPDGKVGVLSREDFQKLLDKYKSEHGVAMRYENDSKEFADIVNGIKFYRGDEGNYDVRYLAADDRYAFVVLSVKGSPWELKEYVLKAEGTGWIAVAADFEYDMSYQRVINDIVPDFNLDILPEYTLYYHGQNIKTDFSIMLSALRTNGIIEPSDGATTFETGTGDFVYFEFEGGRKMLGILSDERGWVMHPIKNFVVGEMLMKDFADKPPYFILKQ